ncbi:amino acid adenylation domain-containing protein [Calothrix sp. FACHB-1219]|uniref:non-ribosomal peptide synthetase n=1 Tax=unclassified Calothrix TaxID=2619626 RepID=UPI001682A7DB|nr:MULTISPECIES: non-ribosomal peptide synthetase [unclassified Calothrix]MBD2201842.1 amino acid adenylation domain-containing protein [Calothrix sp. FACHB-168]MBD2217528.1 amino acid adenylation domain-containing protein [Calothrix sp. FACHB-1219]
MDGQEHKNDLLAQKIYWLNKLSGELPETNLMLDYVRPVFPCKRNKSLGLELSHDVSQKIIKLSRGSEFSTYWILLSALNILLYKYSRKNDAIAGIPRYTEIATNDVKAKFIPLRTQVKSHISFKDYLLQVKDEIIGAYNNQNCDLEELISLLNIPSVSNRCPLFNVVVLLENIHDKNIITDDDCDLVFSFSINEESINLNIEYSDYLFRDENINLFGRYYSNFLTNALNNINEKISDITLFSECDRYQLLKHFNNNHQLYPVEQTINQLFEQQVYKTPDNIAVVYQQKKLTYQELNEAANQLAITLRQLGLSKDDLVGIFKDRDINFLIAILAIYKAGGVYVPIDSTYPANRIEYMLTNSEVKFLLTDATLLNILNDLIDKCSQLKSIICLDEVITDNINWTHNQELIIYQQLDFSNISPENIEPVNKGSDIAYTIYTSGSTGLPKGTMVRHDGAINHIYAQFDELKLTAEFCFLQSAPSSTDISIWQFLAPLLIGGKTVIVDIETVAIPEQLFKILKAEKITVVELVPALFGGLLEYISQLPNAERELPDLQWMMLSGESVAIKWVNQWLKIYPNIKIVNAYGPSEAADDITQFIVDKPLPENQRTIPIGKPLANLNLYILDEQMKLLPIGAPGEICVSGIGVGAGYWKNEEKTQLSFVPNPFTDVAQKLPENRPDLIYKTGDLGRWLLDGNIEFLGRIDHQVKIRGFRVELGEIESLLSQHQAVKNVVVVVREENPNDKRLVAYVVPQSELARDDTNSSKLISELRNFLQEKLPGHMIPSFIVLLEALPLAPSGKVDRQALPIPSFQNESEFGFVAPRTPTEEIVADIWGQVLKQEHIGIHDDFFDLGGHSLLATQAISRLREAFKIELPLRSLFEAPTVAQIVPTIENMLTIKQLQFVSPNGLENDREEIEL